MKQLLTIASLLAALQGAAQLATFRTTKFVESVRNNKATHDYLVKANYVCLLDTAKGSYVTILRHPRERYKVTKLMNMDSTYCVLHCLDKQGRECTVAMYKSGTPEFPFVLHILWDDRHRSYIMKIMK